MSIPRGHESGRPLAGALTTLLAVLFIALSFPSTAQAATVTWRNASSSPSAWYTSAAVTLHSANAVIGGDYRAEVRVRIAQGSVTKASAIGNTGTTGASVGYYLTAGQDGRTGCSWAVKSGGNSSPRYMQCKYTS